jgi:hypothetical protein
MISFDAAADLKTPTPIVLWLQHSWFPASQIIDDPLLAHRLRDFARGKRG